MIDWGPILGATRPWIESVPPWALLSTALGLVSAAAYYLAVGTGLRSLPLCLALGMVVGPLAQLVGFRLPLPPPPFSIGEVHLPAVAGGTWTILLMARLLHL
ncbi:MAG: hypothetical protein IT307_01625 [Chloroflexi bacterium]|nr:hypothetical protein [Chloroflexota bacterium]